MCMQLHNKHKLLPNTTPVTKGLSSRHTCLLQGYQPASRQANSAGRMAQHSVPRASWQLWEAPTQLPSRQHRPTGNAAVSCSPTKPDAGGMGPRGLHCAEAAQPIKAAGASGTTQITQRSAHKQFPTIAPPTGCIMLRTTAQTGLHHTDHTHASAVAAQASLRATAATPNGTRVSAASCLQQPVQKHLQLDLLTRT